MAFMKLFSSKTQPRETAKERLKLILIHDRGDISPEILEKMKLEILAVITKYIEIDHEEVDVKLTKSDDYEGCGPALVANIPIKGVR